MKDLGDRFIFIPLMGVKEIGPNCYLYSQKSPVDGVREWLIVDCGIGFIREMGLPGVDVVVPDISFILNDIIDKGDRLVGMLLTHVHEDHIGAVPYLWQDLNCDIYTTKIAASMLKNKFMDMGICHNTDEIPIKEISVSGPIKIGSFDIDMIGITHSVPEMSGAFIKTPHGNVFHTGDWKIDDAPQVGQETNWKALSKASQEGVLAVACDSTNVMFSGCSGSEGTVRENLEKVITKRKKGLIIVTTFASNIARFSSICKSAAKAGRRVFLAGRALSRMYLIARENGYLKDIEDILPLNELSNYPRDKAVVICTGCQGEERAALSKIANNEHPDIKISGSDLIVFSSKIIPGNEKRIGALMNQYASMDIDILCEMDDYLHSSGHPGQEELAKMYEVLKPKYVIPVHGEQLHIRAHVKFAKEQGYEALKLTNGDVVVLNKDKCEVIDQIDTGYIAVDGNCLLPINSPILRNRKTMAEHGAVFISVVWHRKNKSINNLDISAPGIFDFYGEDREILKHIQQSIYKGLTVNNSTTEQSLKKSIVSMVKKIVKEEAGKYPTIYVHMM